MESVAILIVDDEPPLLRLMQAFLERHSYQVTACATAAEALEFFRTDTSRFRVVIADLTLPDMQGDAMALQMVEEAPDLRVLLCSGYPFDLQGIAAAVRRRFGTLQKPFLPNMLTRAVEDLLNRSV